MNILSRLKYRILPADPVSVAAYRTVLPKNIHVSVKKDKEYFIATVDKVNEEKITGLLITEAKDMDSLIRMVNDLIFTYIKMPDNIRPYYGDIFKPEGYQGDSKSIKGSNKLVLIKTY